MAAAGSLEKRAAASEIVPRQEGAGKSRERAVYSRFDRDSQTIEQPALKAFRGILGIEQNVLYSMGT